jgi:hypothetical protein
MHPWRRDCKRAATRDCEGAERRTRRGDERRTRGRVSCVRASSFSSSSFVRSFVRSFVLVVVRSSSSLEKKKKEETADLQLGQAVVFVQDDEGVALLVGHLIAGVLEVDDLVASL